MYITYSDEAPSETYDCDTIKQAKLNAEYLYENYGGDVFIAKVIYSLKAHTSFTFERIDIGDE